jgi:hypothetical protein
VYNDDIPPANRSTIEGLGSDYLCKRLCPLRRLSGRLMRLDLDGATPVYMARSRERANTAKRRQRQALGVDLTD